MLKWTIRLAAVTAVAAAILAMPASAQMGNKRGGGGEAPKGPEKPKVDEKAYKAAMERIPEPKEKYDPWGGVAPAPAAPAKKK
ncbi:hypothetical protein [Tardiphaga sp.]|uniref:hypothetical protein n=1 Tax=Tardiphaga sp. TaxID=1926292 RepID=UPI0026201084|nr:hypothetical protein [Tardiphaga sp.]MDB5615798.1 hypothetical protein [Tardiphaga sp.]